MDAPDVIGGTLLRYRKHLGPLPHLLRAEVKLAEQVPPGWFDPRFAYEGATSEGEFEWIAPVCIGGEVIQDFVDDLLREYGGYWGNRTMVGIGCGPFHLRGLRVPWESVAKASGEEVL